MVCKNGVSYFLGRLCCTLEMQGQIEFNLRAKTQELKKYNILKVIIF